MAIHVTDALKTKTRARLARCARWLEHDRMQGMVILIGARDDGLVLHEELSEDALKALIAEGQVKCDASQRIERFNGKEREVTLKYWSVDGNTPTDH